MQAKIYEKLHRSKMNAGGLSFRAILSFLLVESVGHFANDSFPYFIFIIITSLSNSRFDASHRRVCVILEKQCHHQLAQHFHFECLIRTTGIKALLIEHCCLFTKFRVSSRYECR